MTLRETGLSIIHPFYNDFRRLPFHVKNWGSYNPESRSKLHFVLVDDYSIRPLIGVIDVSVVENLYVYRVMEDLRWNTPGALNLGVMQAPTEWVCIMDSDCMFFPENLEKLLDFEPEPDKFYYFKRQRISDTMPEKLLLDRYLPCAILMTKTAFLNIGGFDEDFSGAHSGGYGFFDTDLENRIKVAGLRRQVDGVFIHEYMEDIMGPNVHTRERVRNKGLINKKLYYQKIAGEVPRGGKLCRFRWQREWPVDYSPADGPS